MTLKLYLRAYMALWLVGTAAAAAAALSCPTKKDVQTLVTL